MKGLGASTWHVAKTGAEEGRVPSRLLAIAVTILVMSTAAAVGTVLSGDDPFAVLESYDQPWFGLPAVGWVVVGIVYYAAMAAVTYRLVRRLPASRAAFGLVLAVVGANEAWNVLVFRFRAPWLAAAGLVAFAGLVTVAFLQVRRHDALSARIVGVYVGWLLVYDLPWILAIALSNPA